MDDPIEEIEEKVDEYGYADDVDSYRDGAEEGEDNPPDIGED